MEALFNPAALKQPRIFLDTDTLKYAFQPIFDVRTGDVYGHEALMRPKDYTPFEIIEAYTEAEQLDQIEEATMYYGVKAFMDAGLDGYLFVNTFPGACMSLKMAQKVAELGGPEMANRFYIEILEYTNLNPFAWNIKRRAMEATGAMPHLAIDDFGTGINTDLRCIDLYKPELVKIDRKYISHIETNLEHQKTVSDMIQNLHGIGIKVLAEGVETEAEYKYLMRTDIDYMQGYYLGRPKIYE